MGRNGSPTTAASVGAPGRVPGLGGRLTDRVASRLFGLPPATTGYTVSRRVRVPVRDGVDLAADLYQPDSDAVGTLLVRGPYGRFLPQALGFARVFAARGYNVLFVSSRGTFGSGGTFYPMKSEADDGHDVVGWMVDQPWFSGTFATLGGSYLGHTQWALGTRTGSAARTWTIRSGRPLNMVAPSIGWTYPFYSWGDGRTSSSTRPSSSTSTCTGGGSTWP